MNIEAIREITADRFAQRQKPRVTGITGFATVNTPDSGFARAPGSAEIRLADTERKHVIASHYQLEKSADARRRNRLDRAVQFRPALVDINDLRLRHDRFRNSGICVPN